MTIESDYYAQLEMTLDELKVRVKALEDAVTAIPQINFEADPSKPQGVVVEPAALVVP